MKRVRLLLAAAVAVGTMAVAPAASAQAEGNCVGAEGQLVVCVEPTGQTLFETCVYAGGEDCTPVVVPGPLVTRCDANDHPKAVVWVIVRAVCDAIT
jgi:hypothetical protein